MRFSPRRAALAACFVSLSAAPLAALAQAPPVGARPALPAAAPAADLGTRVAVIDIADVFKQHIRFNGAMGDIKKDIEGFEAYVKGEQQKFAAGREELATFKPGSLEFKQKEEQLAKMQSDMQVQVGLKRKEFLEQEARVYYRVYLEIEQSVGNFALRNRIGLVLRFNSEKMREDDRASVLQGVNRAVVFQQNLDITQWIVKDLNGNTPAPAPAPTPTTNGQGGNSISTPRGTGPVIPGRTPIQR